MLKFLRKYNKYILVVGGVLLMVAFLLQGVLGQLSKTQGTQTVMRVSGEKVTNVELDLARRELVVIKELAPQVLSNLKISDSGDHWYLLTRMAERAGYVGGPQDGRATWENVAQSLSQDVLRRWEYSEYQRTQQFPAQAEIQKKQLEFADNIAAVGIRRARSTANLTDDQFYTVFAKAMGIARLQSSLKGAARVSSERCLIEAKRQLDAAVIDYVFIPPERVTADVGEPDDAALKAQFDRFRTTPEGKGDFGIGYLLPARVKLEWLTLDHDAIAKAVTVDPVEVRKKFAQGNPGGTPGETFEQARPRLESQIRQEMVQRILQVADTVISSQVALATRKLPKDGQFRVLPPDWNKERPNFANIRDIIVQRVKEQTGVQIPATEVTVKDAQWLSLTDLSKLPGIGTASLARGSRQEPFTAYALGVRELGGLNDFGIQVGIPGSPVADKSGSKFYFTVLDARRESAPDSIDEIRPRLVDDWKRLQAFEALKRDAESYRQKAITSGLESLDESANRPPINPAEPTPPDLKSNATVTRKSISPADPNVDLDSFREAVVTAASSLDPTVDPNSIPLADRTLAIPLPPKLGLAVVRIMKFTPMTMEAYRQNAARMARQLQLDEFDAAGSDAFSLAALRKRLNVKAVTPGGEEQSSSPPSGSGDLP